MNVNILKKTGIIFLLLTIISCGSKKYVSYKVKKGDTMENIAQKYNISKGELFKINPGIHRDPPPNTILIVPETEKTQKSYKEDENYEEAKEVEKKVEKIEKEAEEIEKEAEKMRKETKKVNQEAKKVIE